jgi:hypothetical protein
MTPEEIQKHFTRFVDKVRQMRGLQREYFRYRARADLDRARKLEREVDQLITEEINRIKSKQKELFT